MDCEPTPEQIARVEAAVASLPEIEREILLAARLDNMSYADIARRTGRSVKDIEKRIATAVRLLTRRFEEDGWP